MIIIQSALLQTSGLLVAKYSMVVRLTGGDAMLSYEGSV